MVEQKQIEFDKSTKKKHREWVGGLYEATQKPRVYYDTIVMRCEPTENMLKILENSFSYGRIQSFRMAHDDTYKDSTTINLADFRNGLQLNQNERWTPESIWDLDKFGAEYDEFVNDTGEIVRVKRGFYETRGLSAFYTYKPSSNYEMNIRLLCRNSDIGAMALKHVLEFEFSIPKFLYGHNLLLYPHYGDVDGTQLDYFIEKFFRLCFDEDYMRLNIEIRRLDCCFNYKFKTSADFNLFGNALKFYFENNKSKSFVKYKNETFMYKTEGYSIKFYDKQTEFMKNDYNELRKFYIRRNKAAGVDLKQSIKSAEKQVLPFVDFSKNIWRLEISLRASELNECYWRDWRFRDFPEKTAFVKRYSSYNFIRNTLKVFSSLMDKPYDVVDRFHRVRLISDDCIKRYVESLKWDVIPATKYGPAVKKRREVDGVVVLVSEMKPVDLWRARFDFRSEERMKLMQSFIDNRVFEKYRWIERRKRQKYMTPTKCRQMSIVRANMAYHTYAFDTLMLQRIYKMQGDFIRIVKMIRNQKRVPLAKYIQAHSEYIGDVLRVGNNDVVLTKTMLAALVRYQCHIKNRVDVPKRTEMRNKKILAAYCEKYGVCDNREFVLKEFFDLTFAFNEYYFYICPIINNTISGFIIGDDYLKMNRL